MFTHSHTPNNNNNKKQHFHTKALYANLLHIQYIWSGGLCEKTLSYITERIRGGFVYPAISQLVRAFVPIPYSILSMRLMLSINILSVCMCRLKALQNQCGVFTACTWFISVNTHIIVFCLLQTNSSHPRFKGCLQAGYCYSTVLTQLVTYHTCTWHAGRRVSKPLCDCVNWYCHQLRFLEVFMVVCRVNTIIRVWPSSNRQTVINKTFREGTQQRFAINIRKKKGLFQITSGSGDYRCKF